MKISATPLLTCAARGIPAAIAALGAVMLAAPAPVLAQDEEREERVVRDRSPNARDVAMTPLSDLNIAKDEIPEVLQEAEISPYAHEKLATCDDIVREVDRLTAVLGPDVELEVDEGGMDVGEVAQSVVGSFIPFRGIIRRVSGASKREREFKEAIYSGAVRRGFLKGLGEARGCGWPARPATVAERDAYLASLEDEDGADTADESEDEAKDEDDEDGGFLGIGLLRR